MNSGEENIAEIREACSYDSQTEIMKDAFRRWLQEDESNRSKTDSFSPNILERLSIANGLFDADGTWSPFYQQSYSTSFYPCNSLREQDDSADDILYCQIEQAMTDAANARREEFSEAIQAEKELSVAIRWAEVSEILYAEELKHRKETEEELIKERIELNNVKNQVNEMMEELQIAHNKELALKNQIAQSDLLVKELEQKIFSATKLLHSFENDRDELRSQRDEAVKRLEKLHNPQFFTEFSLSEIEEAIQNFNPSLRIEEGGFGSIYKGLLRHTEVAIKVFHSRTLQSQVEFERGVDVLSKIRHPNLVTLIGACPDALILVYDNASNGNLEDRLVCKANSSPLSWKTRIRIATELCSALVFLHSSRPCRIIHGDLRPMNILLDSNHISKLAEFGSYHFLPHDEKSGYNENLLCRTNAKNHHDEYMDPEFLSSGKLTTKSDVYSFGIVLLRLLTGKPDSRIINKVQVAIDNGKLKDIVDPLAGDWPFMQAEQLAQLALRCCNKISRNRPDLGSDVWRVLEPMRAYSGGSTSFCLASGKQQVQPPPYFICPILRDVMEDPHVAADGFTYEKAALIGWLDSGHSTSPMTNLKLGHRNLVPNRALRSAIQEWMQQHQYIR